MRTEKMAGAALALSLAVSAVNPAGAAPDSIGKTLQAAFIWTEDAPPKRQAYAVFRRTFEIAAPPANAHIRLFADSRYALFVNGRYVLSGPGRFDPIAPQYDTVDIRSLLHPGKNAVAVVVHSFWDGHNGRMMNHAPGLTAQIQIEAQRLQTGTDWRVTTKSRFLPSPEAWGSIPDNIDARRDKGDWTQTDFDDSDWRRAKPVNGKTWGQLTPRAIPLLKETAVPLPEAFAETLPTALEAGKPLAVNVGRMTQGYVVADFEAEAGTVLEMEGALGLQNGQLQENYGMGRYVAKAGRQIWQTGDVWGFHYLTIRVVSGSATLRGVKIVNRSYPFEAVSPFQSDDARLNELWRRSVRTIMLCSEDGYLDCTPRERTEWMGDAALVEYPITRTALIGTDADGAKRYGDPRLIRQMLLHIAQSQQPDGRLKAHHPSDRWDIHGYIEDYACLWVQTLREYYDAAGDAETAEALWPALVRQMAWFLERRTRSGLVEAREFVFFDNPNKYKIGESATLNAYLIGAMRDAAILGKALGKSEALVYKKAAEELTAALNETLWNEAAGTYDAAIIAGAKAEPTAHAAMIALYYGAVPKARVARVLAWLTAHQAQVASPYAHRFLLEVLFRQDTPQHDALAFEIIREKWKPTLDRQDTGTVFEVFGGGSLCHNMGAMGAYFLSAFTLGVRMEEPARKKRIVIAPHLADLKTAQGSVVTPFGEVAVTWKIEANGTLRFVLSVPKGVRARVALPDDSETAKLTLDDAPLAAKRSGRRLVFEIGAGTHRGTLGH